MLRPLLLQNSSVSLIFEDPIDLPEIYSDEAKISQILRNFISNALKFTERGEVRVSARRGHDDTAIFAVADTGIGIAEEDQDRVFKEWEQVDGKFQKTAKGTGLGLPLSRKLAQLLGGDVYLKSQLGIGSTFSFAVPLQFAGATEAVFVPDVKRELDASKLPVLVVEDNREALFIYEKYLKTTEFQVVPAQDLKEARRALKEFNPVAVVLDVLLQGEHSWQLLEDLKRDPATRDIPVFVVTVVENEKKAIALGATAFHAKPIDRVWLLSRLRATSSRVNKSLLIVDDDDISRYLVKSLLGNNGYLLLEADRGTEALRLAREGRPDLIVLDLSMPDMSGFEVLDALKADSTTREIPVVIYTSQILTGPERERLEAAVDVVPKETVSREKAGARFAEALARGGLKMRLNVVEEQSV
jgi:CheY-like chemotaxis protein